MNIELINLEQGFLQQLFLKNSIILELQKTIDEMNASKNKAEEDNG